MTLSEQFNKLAATKMSDCILQVQSGYHYFYYDFAQRIMTAAIHHGGSVTPFAQLDREVLIAARDRLVALGGTPPELPPETPAATATAKKFNL